MSDFIKIKTVFNNSTKRTVEELSKCYLDKELLRSIISELIKNTLLKDVFLKDKKILIKPNWVRHSLQPHDEICLRTNDHFLLALISILLEHSPNTIILGDAPLQGCKWEKMHNESFLAEIEQLSVKYNIPIIIKDFRRITLDPVNNILTIERHTLSEYLIFDVGKDSYLEPISLGKSKFRVTCYDPNILAESHEKSKHRYCITKELFDADVVISVPKFKTHQKTGITGALKNLVGVNGDKAYLPHHRIGSVENGGDCYPGKNILRSLSEKTLDFANRKIGKPQYRIWQSISSYLWAFSKPKAVHQLAAGWYGNDTCWRMVMDLNKIAIYGKKNGKLSSDPQRVLYSICDGIIGGQGDGPLNPSPLPLGIVTFSNNSAITDICAAILMRFDINKISLLKNAAQQIHYENIELFLNNENITVQDLSNWSIETIPPPGWADYLKEKG